MPDTAYQSAPGYLTAQVYRYNAAAPVSGAVVRVYRPDNPQPLYEFTTGLSGLTPTMALDAPPRKYSLTPQTLHRPYAVYNMEVEYQGHLLVIEGIQIFAGTMAVQRADLTSLMTRPVGAREVIIIPEHTLWGPHPPQAY